MIKKCLICDKEYSVKPSRFEKSKTCSLECVRIFFSNKEYPNTRVKKECSICKKVFEVAKSKVNRRFCCSDECRWKNGMSQSAKEKMSLNKIAFYKNGGISPRTGKKHTLETKNKISAKNINPSEETRLKMSCSQKKKPKIFGIKHSEETKKKIGFVHLGRKHTEETKNKQRGANHPGWKGGITNENTRIRNSEEYKIWRKAVYQRDNYTCVWCGGRGERLNADHIKPFSLFPELRFEISNGRTLCVSCHKTTKSYGNKHKTRSDYDLGE